MRLPVNSVIHTTLVGLEPATFRSLVDCWSSALPVVPPNHQVTCSIRVSALHFTGTTKCRGNEHQAATVNWQRWCGRDMRRQVVPDIREATIGKGSIADGCQQYMADRQRWRRRWSSPEVRGLEEFVNQLRRSCHGRICRPEWRACTNLFWRFQPM